MSSTRWSEKSLATENVRSDEIQGPSCVNGDVKGDTRG